MKKSLLYVIGVFVAVAWLWNAKYVSLSGPNFAEAVGFNVTSLGLALLLLVFASKWLYRSLRKHGAVAPYKITFGSISGCLAFFFIPDALNASASHRAGAGVCFLLFGVISTVLLVLAYRGQHRLKDTSMSMDK